MYDRIWLNGAIQPLAYARIAPSSGGVVYGWGVFTTLGIGTGRALAPNDHWDRLVAHAARANVPLTRTREEVLGGLAELIEMSGLREGRARITVLRASAGIWRAEDGNASDVCIFVTARKPPRDKPYSLGVSPFRINTGSPLCGVKTTAYVDHIMAIEESRERGFDEALLLNERGELVEASAANVFWVRDGDLMTPSTATGCVSGVVRKLVVETAERLRIRLIEGSYTTAALAEADEVFLTSSGFGITPVGEFLTHRYEPAPGPITERLRASLRYA